ncbi:MAG TPA: hypothetical protein VFY73_11245 [Ideonella sp.]|uniref:hypothetical protein n=1 Tax=Ideonella sp. TaxID=1929293 RepID=UPI002E322266|nr:hypothetical protein [Ideonella sp.]HEX5684595.1 hypothetical protein [Ideonella sp.]
MNNAILEVVIGLVLVYLIVSLLATKVQELWFGTMWKGRVKNLHLAVFEAVGRDATMRDKVFANPLVFSLFEGDQATQGAWWQRPTGPSAIAPDVFARALLIEVNELNPGRHPSEQFTTPAGFLAERGHGSQPVWKSLRALLPGNEASWQGFEAAIARWFCDITDRSSGWYQRKMQGVGFALAVLLAGLLNIDTFYIAEALSTDPEQRRALVTLAEDVDRLVRSGAGSSTASAAAAPQAKSAAALSDRPSLRVSTRLDDAMVQLDLVYRHDDAIAKSAPDLFPVEKHCAIVNEAALANRKLSNTFDWLYVLPAVKASIDDTRVPPPPGAAQPLPARQTLEQAFRCLNQISAWAQAAPAGKDERSRKAMREAIGALTDAKTGVLAMLQDLRAGRSVRATFLRDPAAFADCAAQSVGSRAVFDDCVQRAGAEMLQLPVLFTERNLRMQFYRVGPSGDKEDFQGPAEHRFAGDPLLGLPAMYLEPLPLTERWTWVAGVLASAFFISLGSPFWFGLLEKVMRLRSMGKTREDEESNVAARGLAAGPAAPDAKQAPAAEPFSFAVNEFERNSLQPRDIVLLQQHLGMASHTGNLDEATRAAIEDFTRKQGLPPTNQLDSSLFFRITGRPSSATPIVAGQGRLQRGQEHPAVPELADTLQKMMGLQNPPVQRVPATERRFSDDLRALALLYRYKTDTAADPQRQVFDDALKRPEVLDRVDETLLAAIRASATSGLTLPVDPAPWMDWAIGELGQVERNEKTVAASNPRICEYLAAAGLPNDGDATPWCGAFVAWVVNQHNSHASANAALPAPPPTPAGAVHWKGWATSRTVDASGHIEARRGDVVLMRSADTDGTIRHHVGFCLLAEPDRIWLLAGNQAKGTRVCLRAIPRQHVEAVNGP